MSINVRPPAVAGTFYPSSERQLRSEVTDFLAAAEPIKIDRPKCLIVPHAGFIYSASTAASAYCSLDQYAKDITKVVLMGPSHRVPLRGIAIPRWRSFATPLGAIELDQASLQKIENRAYVVRDNAPHQLEHSLEVQLPFLQVVLPDFNLVPLVVGDCAPNQVAEIIDQLWGGDETLFVCSTDLSHFHPYEEATLIDSATCDQILDRYTRLVGTQACGCSPLNGVLNAALKRGLEVRRLSYRNSGDTAGSHDSVVGYGAFAVG
jgi:hypothetical protein